MKNAFRQLKVRLTMLAVDESGMSTVEYSTVSCYTASDDVGGKP
jgi:hypothetical protein